MSIEVGFPEKILRRINEISRREDAVPEEIINLSEKYFSDAEELIKEGGYVQASDLQTLF